MNNTIKTRQAVISVKTADHKKNLSHYMKKSSIRSKQSQTNNKEEQQNSPSGIAIEDIQTTWKKSVYESGFRLRKGYESAREYLPFGKEETVPDVRPQPLVLRKISSVVQNSPKVQMVRNTIRNYAERARNYNRFTTFISNTFSYAGRAAGTTVKAVRMAGKGVSLLFSAGSGVLLILTLTLFFGVFSSFTNTTVLVQGIEIPEASVQPDFTNEDAWGDNNPYTRLGLTGQCTWFAWGRFYEIYGYSPGFTGDGWNCAYQLVAAHPDRFELSYSPAAGAVFSTIGHNHVGIVIAVDGDRITVQDGNLDGVSNPLIEAMTDWHEVTWDISAFVEHHGGVIYAVPINAENL